jgi:CHAD domain-containing protein
MASAPVVVTEIERKFEPGPGFRLPDLSGLPGVAGVSEPKLHELDATYFDSEDLRLVRNKITLRRRTGGDDAGWHLKRPRVDGDRDELRAPLGRSARNVPPQLRAPVEVHLRGAKLVPVVRLATARTVRHLLDADGAVLAEVAQDDVTASLPAADGGSTAASTWHELEVELVGGDHALLDAVVRRVVDAGAPPSSSASKLSRALGDRLPNPAPELPKGVGRKGAGAVLLDHLGEHVTRLKRNDPLVRVDQHDAVHQMRVATRRLRSALATYRPLVDRAVTDPLREELTWLGEVLGHARDAEVIRDELRDLVGGQPPELVFGPVSERIATALGARYRSAHAEVLVTLNGARYFALLDGLDRLLTDPPLTDAARADADAALRPLVARTFNRMRALVGAARAETDPRHRDELLHEVRKAAKRARYAGESLVAMHGRYAKEWAGRMEAIQESLGEHQDSVVIRAELLALAGAAHAAGEDTFSYGRLHALEQARAQATRSRFDDLWNAARKKRLHAWLRG